MATTWRSPSKQHFTTELYLAPPILITSAHLCSDFNVTFPPDTPTDAHTEETGFVKRKNGCMKLAI